MRTTLKKAHPVRKQMDKAKAPAERKVTKKQNIQHEPKAPKPVVFRYTPSVAQLARPTKVVGLKNGGNGGVNPKDKIGATKVDFTLIPVSGTIACAKALQFGANIYGAYNWRVEPVLIRTYLGAIQRHTLAVQESEDIDPVSMVEHLGHVMANAAILIDAIKLGMAVDDRPILVNATQITDANAWVKRFINKDIVSAAPAEASDDK